MSQLLKIGKLCKRDQAEYKRYLHFEEIFWQQKVGYDWFDNGDRNTKFFHCIVKGRRKKLHLKRILSQEGNWLEEEDDITVEALEKVKNVVFNLKGDRASGPDGFTGKFYQCYLDIIGKDIHRMVIGFFRGNTLPKSVTHTYSVLLPKKELVNTFSDLRPISLSNFIIKIISRIMHDIIEAFLPRLVSANQSGFVIGRSIIENVLLTQEIVTGIRKRGNPTNVVIKIDMMKDYDRVSWFFLMKVLRRRVFLKFLFILYGYNY
ncbi:uncharacterized protein LOC107862039 [Capsicum annuum]|uniref:uncharacterized protein LOC107862039 n=1 Tax=Capsicum annuum TaxID=4072 RepID=UPI001FB10AC2|nr:uncharacterized protein LOC107862039 [Capsicum annuum]